MVSQNKLHTGCLALCVAISVLAVDGFRTARADVASTSPVFELLAQAEKLKANGALGRASAILERALRIAPQDAEIWQQLALVRQQQGKPEQARALSAKAQQLTQNTAPSAEPGRDQRAPFISSSSVADQLPPIDDQHWQHDPHTISRGNSEILRAERSRQQFNNQMLTGSKPYNIAAVVDDFSVGNLQRKKRRLNLALENSSVQPPATQAMLANPLSPARLAARLRAAARTPYRLIQTLAARPALRETGEPYLHRPIHHDNSR